MNRAGKRGPPRLCSRFLSHDDSAWPLESASSCPSLCFVVVVRSSKHHLPIWAEEDYAYDGRASGAGDVGSLHEYNFLAPVLPMFRSGGRPA